MNQNTLKGYTEMQYWSFLKEKHSELSFYKFWSSISIFAMCMHLLLHQKENVLNVFKL